MIPVVASVDPLLDGVTDLEGMATAVGAAVRLHEYVQTKLDVALANPANQRAGVLGVHHAWPTRIGQLRLWLRAS